MIALIEMIRWIKSVLWRVIQKVGFMKESKYTPEEVAELHVTAKKVLLDHVAGRDWRQHHLSSESLERLRAMFGIQFSDIRWVNVNDFWVCEGTALLGKRSVRINSDPIKSDSLEARRTAHYQMMNRGTCELLDITGTSIKVLRRTE